MVGLEGQVLQGRYLVKGSIGSGTFANIYLAEELVSGEEVAIKTQNEGFQMNSIKVSVQMDRSGVRPHVLEAGSHSLARLHA
jgi:serine/threonine protein kinase